jgi:hypothetical protein
MVRWRKVAIGTCLAVLCANVVAYATMSENHWVYVEAAYAPDWYNCSAVLETPHPADYRWIEVNVYSPDNEWIAHGANNFSNGSIVQASTGIAPHGRSGTYRCVATFIEDGDSDEMTEYFVVP